MARNWNEHEHPRHPEGSGRNSGRFRDRAGVPDIPDWAQRISDQIGAGRDLEPFSDPDQPLIDDFEARGLPVPSHLQKPILGDEFFEMRMAMGGESEEPIEAFVENIDHYRNRTEIQDPDTGEWDVVGDAWLSEDGDYDGSDFYRVTRRNAAGSIDLTSGDTVRIRPIAGG